MNVREAVSTFRGHRVPNVSIIPRKKLWFMLSGTVLVLSLVGLLLRGLNLSIDFKGGAELSYPLDNPAVTVADVQSTLARFGRGDAEVQIVNGNQQVQIRTRSLSIAPAAAPTRSPGASAIPTSTASPTASPTASSTEAASASATTGPTSSQLDQIVALKDALAKQAGVTADQINITDVGPTWGSQISHKALFGLIVVLIAITLYIALRFEWKMAIGAQAAMVHDVVITGGVYALTGREVTPATVIAVLTILGFSLYDTVVIYDKIQENTESPVMLSKDSYSGVVNTSMNQVLMRSVNTSLVVVLPILSLLLFGGSTLKDFAFAMMVGVISGAYSSIFVAAPILSILKEREPKYQQIRIKAGARAAVSERQLRAVPKREELPVQAAAREVSTGAVATAAATRTAARQGSSSKPRPKGKKKPTGKKKRR